MRLGKLIHDSLRLILGGRERLNLYTGVCWCDFVLFADAPLLQYLVLVAALTTQGLGCVVVVPCLLHVINCCPV